MRAFDDAVANEVEHLVDLDRSGRLPFDWYGMGRREGRIEITVSTHDRHAALDYFARHPSTLPDGTHIPVDVLERAGLSWVSEPIRGANPQPDRSALEGLIGLDVNSAAVRANAGGWLVRAYEPEAILTADFRPNRANIRFGSSGEVISVHVG